MELSELVVVVLVKGFWESGVARVAGTQVNRLGHICEWKRWWNHCKVLL